MRLTTDFLAKTMKVKGNGFSKMPFRATSNENINKNEIKIIFLTCMC